MKSIWAFALFLLMIQSSLAEETLHLGCLLRYRSDTEITKLQEWSAPVTHSSVYYYSEIDAEYSFKNEKIKIYSRYSLNNGHFYIEVRNWDKNNMAYADSYQQKEEQPHLMLRFDPAFLNNSSEKETAYEVECKFYKPAPTR